MMSQTRIRIRIINAQRRIIIGSGLCIEESMMPSAQQHSLTAGLFPFLMIQFSTLNSQPQHSNHIQHPQILKKVAVLVYPADSISFINTTSTPSSTPVPSWFSSSSAYHWSSSHAALPATPCSFLNFPICNSASLSALSALHTTLKPENSNSPFLTLGGCGWWCCGGANAADADAEEQRHTKWQEQFMLRMYSG